MEGLNFTFSLCFILFHFLPYLYFSLHGSHSILIPSFNLIFSLLLMCILTLSHLLELILFNFYWILSIFIFHFNSIQSHFYQKKFISFFPIFYSLKKLLFALKHFFSGTCQL